MNLLQTRAYKIDALAQLVSASATQAGILNGGKIALFVDEAVTPTELSVPGDFAAPGFTGYAVGTLTFTAPILYNGKPCLVSNTVTFRPTDAEGSTTIAWGVLIKDTTAAKLYLAGKFEVAEALGSATDELKVALRLYLDGTAELIIVS